MNREDQITEWFAQHTRATGPNYPIGIGDDMAQIRLSDNSSVLITTDILLDGVHFELDAHGAHAVGYKAMAASLSDCAAMASVPIGAVVSAALPKGFGEDKIKKLHMGLSQAGDMFDCPIVGGDIAVWKTEVDKLAINVAMLSKPSSHHPPVTRFNARPGDTICVTGKLGASLRGKHLNFTPRVNEALLITNIAKINAMMDITDGLSTDLARICRKSVVGALIEAGQIPISDDALDSGDPLSAALNDGEDFELLFTLSPVNAEKLFSAWNLPVPITRIGTITNPGAHMETMSGKVGTNAAAGKVQMITHDNLIVDLEPGGYDHLA